jgi:hypothetical protein
MASSVDLSPVMRAMEKDFLDFVHLVMESDAGINRKVGVNTLARSDLYQTAWTLAQEGGGSLVVNIMLNDYLYYVEHGRRRGAKMPPVEPIIRWARKNGIPTDNSTIFLIRRAIVRDGIQGRPIMEQVLGLIDEGMLEDNGYLDMVFDQIVKLVDEFFNR